MPTAPGSINTEALRSQLDALCRLLESDGHMTPLATRQIRKVIDQHAAAA